jgi:hypothetical protein
MPFRGRTGPKAVACSPGFKELLDGCYEVLHPERFALVGIEPSRMIFRRSWVITDAVIAMTVISRVAGSALSWPSASIPSNRRATESRQARRRQST